MAERLALPGSRVHTCSRPQQTSVLQVAGKGVRTTGAALRAGSLRTFLYERPVVSVWARGGVSTGLRVVGHGVETLEGQGKCLCQLGQSGWWQYIIEFSPSWSAG